MIEGSFIILQKYCLAYGKKIHGPGTIMQAAPQRQIYFIHLILLIRYIVVEDFYSIGVDDPWRKNINLTDKGPVPPKPEKLIAQDAMLNKGGKRTFNNKTDDIFRDEALEDLIPEQMLDGFQWNNEHNESRGSAKETPTPTLPSSQQLREAMKRKWNTALDEIDSNDTYRLSRYRKLEEEKAKAAQAAAEALESTRVTHHRSRLFTPLAAITDLNKCRRTHHDILALIVSVSADTIMCASMPPKRDLRVMDVSTTKRVCLSVYVDAQNFVPEPGTVAHFKYLTTHEFDGGSLKAFPRECEGKEWFVPDPQGFEYQVAELKDCWARLQSSEQVGFNNESRSHLLAPLDMPEKEDLAGNLPLIRGKKDSTCYFRAKDGSCRYQGNNCAYAHYNTGIVAPNPMLENTKPDSQSNENNCKEVGSGLPLRKSLTCYFWAKIQKCNRSDEECTFAHYDTGTVANPPPGITIFDESKSITPTIPLSKTLTCYFWAKDRKCNRSDEQCAYAHHDTGTVAQPPPQLIATSIPKMRPLTSTNPKMASGSVQPSQNPTCLLYARDGKCNRAESECAYAHFHTGTVSNIPNPPLVPEPGQMGVSQTPNNRPQSSVQHTTTPGSNSTGMLVTASPRPTSASSELEEASTSPLKQLTCYFWANFGRCRRSDAECKFSHFYTGKMAVNPLELPRKKKT